MTPETLRARAAALRGAGEALRRRPARDVIDALAAVLDRWCDPNSPERRALERELPASTGFSAQNVREGVARGLAPWTGDALRALAERELARGGEFARGHDLTAVLLAGSIPMPTLLDTIAPLALRSPVLVKPASRDPVTAPLVARSIAAVDAELGRCVDVVAFPGQDAACLEAFLSADCIVANGSDETIAQVERRVGSGRTLLRHGHRLSIAVLGPEIGDARALEHAARGLAVDTALWDQLGCLSPIAVYAVGDTDACQRIGAALADSLDAIGRELPRGAVDPAAAALAAHERSAAELRAAADGGVVVHAARDGSWTVICEKDPAPRPAPLHRFLRVHPVRSAGALDAALGPLARHLAGVALAGFGAEEPRVAAQLRALGASRICRPGDLEAPPLGWVRDGLAALASLARSCAQVIDFNVES